MARKKISADDGGNEWLNTYADMVTLLLCFFVLLFSMSSTDTEKMDAFMKALSAAGISSAILVPLEEGMAADLSGDFVEVPPGYEGMPMSVMSMDTLYEALSGYVTDNAMQDSMNVSKRGELVHIQFNSSILFNPDAYTMQTGSRPLLDFVGEVLKLYDDKIRFINIGGHTARTGRTSSTVSDWRLSGERAATVAVFLENEAGIDRQKMVTIGYGDNYPIADNDTEEGRSQNRRVELVIVGTESSSSFDIYGVMSGAISESDEVTVSMGESAANQLPIAAADQTTGAGAPIVETVPDQS